MVYTVVTFLTELYGKKRVNTLAVSETSFSESSESTTQFTKDDKTAMYCSKWIFSASKYYKTRGPKSK